MKKLLSVLVILLVSSLCFAQKLEPATITIENLSKYNQTVRIVEFFENDTLCYDVTVKPGEFFLFKIPELKREEWIRVQYSYYYDDKGNFQAKTINANFIRYIQYTDNGYQIK